MSRITLTRFLIERQRDKQLINADLRLLIETVARACKAISNAVTKGSIAGNLGSAGTGNVQGEVQKKLDVLSNDILLEACARAPAGNARRAAASSSWGAVKG